MNRNIETPKAWLLLLLPTAMLTAQTPVLTSDSDGSDGALDVTEDTTLQLPPDGIFQYTTINVAQDATLRFARNLANTPVYLLASDDVTINGTIDVSGSDGTASAPGFGGPGGWDGGMPGQTGSSVPGHGQGPGGGRVGTNHNYTFSSVSSTWSGAGSYGGRAKSTYGNDNEGFIYGNELLLPLLGGSGGAGAATGDARVDGGGGGGGGAILIASDTKIELNGSLLARGGRGAAAGNYGGYPQGGSGGAVRLVAPTVFGTGTIDAGPFSGARGNGGRGRVRVDTSAWGAEAESGQSAPGIVESIASFGVNPVIFAEDAPVLTITDVAGRDLSDQAASAVTVNLPADGEPVQPVTVQAQNFASHVAFVVKVVPERGSVSEFEGTIDNTTDGSASSTINVTFPLNSVSHLYVWTKQLVDAPVVEGE